MNSKSRVHASLRRKSVDRVPIWMWFHPDTTRCPSQALEVPAHQVANIMGDDIRQAWVGNNHAMEGIVHERDGETHTDCWGVEFLLGDDIGGQQSMIMSPRCWRDLIRPHLARIIGSAKSRGMWTAHHSCGAIWPIIQDLIDIGLDVLNPIQYNCPGMDNFETPLENIFAMYKAAGVSRAEMFDRASDKRHTT